jgi:hypothetical protein
LFSSKPSNSGAFQILGEILEARHTAEAEQPLVKYQPLLEFESGRLGDLAAR